MNESSLADGGAADGQETGISVDLDNDDPRKAVVRNRVETPTRRTAKDWAAERAETSKAVKARMDRLAKTLTGQFNQRLADQEAAHQRQLAEINGKLDRFNPRSADDPTKEEAAHQLAMDKFQADLEEAQERGDSKAVAKITRDMTQADNRFWSQQAQKKAGLEDTARRAADAGKPAGEQQQQQQQRPGAKYTKAGVAWAKANASWWDDAVDPTALEARSLANMIHQRMLAEGEDPELPEYFERIREQVAKRFPEIETVSTIKGGRRQQQQQRGPGDDDDDDDDDIAPNARRAPTSMPNRGDPPANHRNMTTLTRADIKTMREVGMNPDDNKHVVQFLRSKQEAEADA